MHAWTRWWPLLGFAFVGLWIGAFAVLGNGIDSHDTDEEIAAYFSSKSNQHKHFVAFFMILGACLLFVWFLGMLRARLAEAEGSSTLSTIAFGSGTIAVAGWLVFDGLLASVAASVNDTSKFHLDPNTFRLIDDLGYLVWFSATTLAFGLVAGTALISLRTGLMPKWIAWLSLVAAVTLLVSFFFIPFFILCGWVLVVSIVLLLKKEATPAPVTPV